MKDFQNIVVKKFDRENYIYKCVLGVQYVKDNTDCDEDRDRYYDLIVENLDVYNYIIKYEIFRNDKFLINVMDIIYNRGLAKVLKAKIKDRRDLVKDELEELFMEYLRYYYDLNKLNEVVNYYIFKIVGLLLYIYYTKGFNINISIGKILVCIIKY